ncbi:DDE-type integrase/transposase/recombinase, partial [Hydrogenivirga sp.]
MSAIMLVRQLLDKVYHWHRVSSSVKAKAVLLYFRGMSLRDVQKYLSDEGYKVSTEAIREWFHSIGKMLKALYTYALWVYVDETKIKKQRKFYYLWLAVDERGRPVYATLTSRRDSWTAQVVLSSTGARGCTTDKGPWYVSAVKRLSIEWVHETFGKRNVVE